MLNEDETAEQGQQVADELMSRLGVCSADLISGSFKVFWKDLNQVTSSEQQYQTNNHSIQPLF